MQKKISSVLSILLLSALLFGSVFAAKPITYTPNDVGTFEYAISEFSDINDQGFAVGSWSETQYPNIPQAFVWSLTEGKTDLAKLPDQTHSQASSINNLGQIAGYCGVTTTTPPSNSPVIWTSPTTIMQLDEDISGQTSDINDKGQIVGFTDTQKYIGATLYHMPQEAFLWTVENGITYLDVPLEDDEVASMASGINNNGIVVGWTLLEDENGIYQPNRAFKWTAKTGTVFLSTPEGTTTSEARNINNKGEIVGNYVLDGIKHAVVWTKNGEIVELGNLYGFTNSVAFGINNKGQTVGFSTSPIDKAAFIWTAKAGLIALPEPTDGKNSKAFAINNAGQIVGTSTVNGAAHAVIWVP